MKRKQLESLKTSLFRMRTRASDKDRDTIDQMLKTVDYAQQLRHTLKEISRIGAKHST